MINWFKNLNTTAKILIICGIILLLLLCCLTTCFATYIIYQSGQNNSDLEIDPLEEETTTSSTTSTTLEDNSTETTIQQNGNKSKDTESNWLDKFPSDFPLFPNRTDIKESSKTQGNTKTFTVTYRTDADMAAVDDFYKKELPNKGYVVTKVSSFEESTQIYFQKSSKLKGNVLIEFNPADDKIDVKITLQSSK